LGDGKRCGRKVEASKVAGVKVCVNSNICTTTDSNGKFTLDGIAPPVNVSVYIGDTKLADVTVPNSSYEITPAVLADGNATLASYIGAFLHMLDGDNNLSKDVIDLSDINSVNINASGNNLIDKIKDKLNSGETNFSFTCSGDCNSSEMNSSLATLYASTSPYVEGKNKNYLGAASAGDFANITYNESNNTLDIKIQGQVFHNVEKEIKIEPIGNSKVFFREKDNNNSFIFLSKTLTVASIDINSNNALLVSSNIPKINTIDTSLITNKRFNYINIEQNSNRDVDIYIGIIEINATHNGATEGNWTDIIDGSHGRWEVNGTYLVAYDENENPEANFIIKPGKKRAVIIVDDVNGGFGIGVEAKPLTSEDFKESVYYFYDDYYDRDGESECFGKVTVKNDESNNKAIGRAIGSRDDIICYDENGREEPADFDINSTLIPNPTITINDQNYTLNGVALVRDEDNETGKFTFVDPEDGFYVFIDTNTTGGEYSINIGSNKPIVK
jgi:hypothetical protein